MSSRLWLADPRIWGRWKSQVAQHLQRRLVRCHECAWFLPFFLQSFILTPQPLEADHATTATTAATIMARLCSPVDLHWSLTDQVHACPLNHNAVPPCKPRLLSCNRTAHPFPSLQAYSICRSCPVAIIRVASSTVARSRYGCVCVCSDPYHRLTFIGYFDYMQHGVCRDVAGSGQEFL